MKFWIVLISLLAMGCATDTGLAPRTTVSGFDNSKVVAIEPHGNVSGPDSAATGLGAQWQASKPDDVLLLVEIYFNYTGITRAELNIDGQKVALVPAPTVTEMKQDIPGLRISTKAFSTTLATVESLAKSKRAWIRIYTPTGFIESAVIDGNRDSKAYHALGRFIVAVESARRK